MSSVLTSGSNTHIPLQTLGYETSRESLNIVHEILGGGIAVSLRGQKPRSGTLAFLFDTEASANAFFVDLEEPVEWTLTDSSRPSIGMNWVVAGRTSLQLDDETREYWIVSVDYQEVV